MKRDKAFTRLVRRYARIMERIRAMNPNLRKEKMTTQATYNKRLLKLADFLDKLPRKRFDYGCWVGDDWKGAPDLSCGTTACALGWATTMPEFRRLGLKLYEDEVTCGDSWNEGAGEAVFGPGTDVLFIPAGDVNATPKQVARKIRRFVKERL